jgi:hypothetical protein
VVRDDWRGVTVCMHVRDYQATTASMVTELPVDPGAPLRAWIALGSPCVSVYVPVFPPAAITPELSEPTSWARFAALRDRVERDGSELERIRAVLAPIEEELWAEADASCANPAHQARFTAGAWPRVDAGLARLGV